MRSRAPDRTRQRILDAAVEVFAGKGYHDTAVDEIVRASATSKGAVYFHFPSKERLFLALIDALAERLLRSVDRAIADVADPLARADAALADVLDTFARHRALAKILLVDAVGCGPAIDRKLLEVHGRIADYIAHHLDEAAAAGAIAPVDTRLAALVWLGALHEVITRWLYTGEPDLAAAQPGLRAMLLRSVGAPDSGAPPHRVNRTDPPDLATSVTAAGPSRQPTGRASPTPDGPDRPPSAGGAGPAAPTLDEEG